MALDAPSSYAAIIDAGSSSSRLYIYQWKSNVALGEPLVIRTVFPTTAEEKKAAEASGGITSHPLPLELEPQQWIHHKRNDMELYLQPMLRAGQAFLQTRKNATSVPLYLLATGGMREDIDQEAQAEILKAAHRVMCALHLARTYDAGRRWATNARVIPGHVEGLYGWAALNYGRGVEEQISGLLELGGASMQIAYKVPSAQVRRERMCLLSGEHRVYSRSWDGFGADSMQRRMLAGLLADAGGVNGTGVIYNPCLPRGEVGSAVNGSKRTTVGSGDFATCLALARGLLKDGLENRHSIPSYLDIASFSKHFFGVSHYWYNYQFFAKWGGYDPRRAYHRTRFTKAVTKYCTSVRAEIPWAEGDKDKTSIYTESRCFSSAWMLTLLHDDLYGFGLEMTKYDTWNGVFRFPTTTDLASRSSWTIGAAALIARHGELRFCPRESGEQVYRLNSSSYPSVAEPIQPPDVVAGSTVGEAGNTFVSISGLAYGFIFVLLVVIAYQRRLITKLARGSNHVDEKSPHSILLDRRNGSVA
ncbi:hypothetical protein D9615_006655 [Tricholomella constricta]|uniref:guanosine-diphosphatase n=1 Tax=Tricholomella constricta TaxID=117010 RepID=A0A8H5HA10_9AGAR|nr:hypothetical protein D9615_006655 [Tricholomella constricta]